MEEVVRGEEEENNFSKGKRRVSETGADRPGVGFHICFRCCCGRFSFSLAPEISAEGMFALSVVWPFATLAISV